VAEDVTDLHAWAEAYLPVPAGWGWTQPAACSAARATSRWPAPPTRPARPPSRDRSAGRSATRTRSWANRSTFPWRSDAWTTRPGPPSPTTNTPGRRSSVVATRSRPRCARRTCASPWAASPPSSPSTTATARSGTPLPWGRTSSRWPARSRAAAPALRPGGLLHHGQGKWYPGEPLPRWAISCYFRKDGQPVWRDPALIADRAVGTAGEREARAFAEALCRRLDLPASFLVPGFEDVLYYMWRERRLPVNVDPFESRLEDEQERARLRRVFEQGLRQVVGFALPLSADADPDPEAAVRFLSGPWFLRDERLYLLPGDSSMGFRLPLDSLPWDLPPDRPPATSGIRWPLDARSPPGWPSRARRRRATSPPPRRSARRRHRAHRSVPGAAPGHVAPVHASAADAGGLPGPGHGGGGHRRPAGPAGAAGGLSPAPRSPARADPGDARIRACWR
jgi:hypothetical protein